MLHVARFPPCARELVHSVTRLLGGSAVHVVGRTGRTGRRSGARAGEARHGPWLETRLRRQDPASGRGRGSRRTALVGPHGRSRRPARGRDVRCHLRLPADHGPQPAARDHDERHRDDRVPADRAGQGPQLPGHLGLLRRRRGRDPGAGRRLRRRDRRDPGRRRRAAAGRRADPLPGLRRAAPAAAAGRHRRGRHADRLQPRAGGGQHLLAAGPVGRAAHDDRRRS